MVPESIIQSERFPFLHDDQSLQIVVDNHFKQELRQTLWS